MIIEKISENLKDIPSLDDFHLERVYLEPEQLLKRILRVKSDHGTELGINLDDNQSLHDGDILFKDKNTIIAIFVNSSKVIKITPKNLHDMGYIAHQLGNRHLPAQFDETSMYVEYDYLVERLLKQLNIAYEIIDTKLKEPFKHIKIEGGHDEVSHDTRKDINKDADKIHSHDLSEHEHTHNHEHEEEHIHSHQHSHGEYTHVHEHPDDDDEHHHIHNHDHEHRHGNLTHSHLHKVTDHHHDHDNFKNGAHNHDHEHKHENHDHEHTHHSHEEE
ncbi:hypothetical protein J6W34_07370 [bacterium]|nr:hypothetical protein [bacterium]